MITAGIDLGSAALKVVFVRNGELLWSGMLPSTAQNREAAVQLFSQGLMDLALQENDLAGVATTGYGKSLFEGGDKSVNEIFANAMGAYILSDKKCRTMINIGGQDVKIIKISSGGKVSDFRMNDKCAAGTGRFFEMAERIMNTPLKDFEEMGRLSRTPVSLNSTCAVFVETEIVSLLAGGRDKNDVIAGIHLSIAKRIASLSANMDVEDEIFLDGGPAANKGLLLAMEDEMLRDINSFNRPQFTVAYGAAILLAMEKGCTA